MSNSTDITIVDYGLGNLFSIERALRYVGAKPEITSDGKKVANAASIVLPGVGAFGDGMANLCELDLIDPLVEHVRSNKPLLGICLGMQLLMNYGEEFGKHKGLGLVPGKVVRLADNNGRTKVPHVGWNRLKRPGNYLRVQPEKSERAEGTSWAETILDGTEEGAFCYFVHSFFAVPESQKNILAVTTYGCNTFCSALKMKNLYGCQFHPERSGHVGLEIYRRFANL